MTEQEFMLQNAQNLMSQGEYEEGVKLLRKLGDNPTALRLLGVAYYYGDGVEEDHNKALEYYVAAYENGERDLEFYETIHKLVQDNLNELKKNRCDFKEEIEPIINFLKFNLDSIAKESRPFNEITTFMISMPFATAYKNCCDIIKVFLNHQGKNNDLSPRLLFLEGMKLGLTEIEFIKDVIPCHERIIGDGDFSVFNEATFNWSIMAMRMFMENVNEVINNKTDAEILNEIFENADRNKR